MDLINIFMALNGFVKLCWGRLFLLRNHLRGCLWFTSVSLWTGLTDWQSLTKLETGSQVDLHMTGLHALLEQTGLLTLNVLMSSLTMLLLRSLRFVILQQTGLLTIDVLTSWLILLTLQTLCSVALLEQTDLRTWNGLTSWLTLLVLQTLRFVVLLDKTGLLRFHGLMSWLVLLALQILRLVVLLEKTGLFIKV